jgi:hypothetical protein
MSGRAPARGQRADVLAALHEQRARHAAAAAAAAGTAAAPAEASAVRAAAPRRPRSAALDALVARALGTSRRLEALLPLAALGLHDVSAPLARMAVAAVAPGPSWTGGPSFVSVGAAPDATAVLGVRRDGRLRVLSRSSVAEPPPPHGPPGGRLTSVHSLCEGAGAGAGAWVASRWSLGGMESAVRVWRVVTRGGGAGGRCGFAGAAEVPTASTGPLVRWVTPGVVFVGGDGVVSATCAAVGAALPPELPPALLSGVHVAFDMLRSGAASEASARSVVVDGLRSGVVRVWDTAMPSPALRAVTHDGTAALAWCQRAVGCDAGAVPPLFAADGRAFAGLCDVRRWPAETAAGRGAPPALERAAVAVLRGYVNTVRWHQPSVDAAGAWAAAACTDGVVRLWSLEGAHAWVSPALEAPWPEARPGAAAGLVTTAVAGGGGRVVVGACAPGASLFLRTR